MTAARPVQGTWEAGPHGPCDVCLEGPGLVFVGHPNGDYIWACSAECAISYLLSELGHWGIPAYRPRPTFDPDDPNWRINDLTDEDAKVFTAFLDRREAL